MTDFVSAIFETLFKAIASLVSSGFALVLLMLLIYPVCQFYWSRVIGCAFLLLAWGIASIAAPLYLASQDFSKGNIGSGLFTLIISSVIVIPFGMGLKAALKWIKNEHNHGRWNKIRWNAR